MDNQKKIKELKKALEVAKQLANIASDWNLDEVEIDNEFMYIGDVAKIFDNALKLLE